MSSLWVFLFLTASMIQVVNLFSKVSAIHQSVEGVCCVVLGDSSTHESYKKKNDNNKNDKYNQTPFTFFSLIFFSFYQLTVC